ncbi:MAG TPA: nitrite reductase small subunit NirD [Acidisphaera sp.]|nr:nitrite reductase small subunit NirD [Acidisphaera sp.]
MDGYFPQAWHDVGTIDDIPPQGARTVATARGQVAIFRTRDDAIFALDDRCPHKDGRLSQGIVHGHSVTCPLHNWVIGLADGRAAEPDEGCVRTIPVRLDGRRILIAVRV